MENNNAIILAMFGTSVAKALPGLFNIRDRMVDAFPAATVRIAFTSQILRRIWHQRAEDPQYRAAHPEIPAEILTIQNPLEVATDLRGGGHGAIVMQPVYMAPAEEYEKLLGTVALFSRESVNPLSAVGRPALGDSLADPLADDLDNVAALLVRDAEYARERGAALIYMGHGSKEKKTGKLYRAFEAAMLRLFPDIMTCVATVDGHPSLDGVLDLLRERQITNVVLKPFMVVAGDHVCKDMIGPAPRGWKKRLEQEGFTVEAVLIGLGEQDRFARIFVDHAFAAARSAGIQLR